MKHRQWTLNYGYCWNRCTRQRRTVRTQPLNTCTASARSNCNRGTAGIPLQQIAGTNTSVFTGCWGQDYKELQARDPDMLPSSFLTGNGTAMLSNRISHFFDLQGASMSIDSGCSSGLVAMHQACRSILWGDSDMSIVTASSAMLSPDLFIALSSLR